VLPYPSLGVGEEDVDGVPCCYFFTDWSGLDLVHVRCREEEHVSIKAAAVTDLTLELFIVMTLFGCPVCQ